MTGQRYRWPSLRSQLPPGHNGPMIGPIGIAIVLIVVIPVSVLVSGAVASGLLGYFLKEEAETANEGSELIATNV
jgi:hypothetical protein